jgi:ribonuclease BN (tRNA processing enzyme)
MPVPASVSWPFHWREQAKACANITSCLRPFTGTICRDCRSLPLQGTSGETGCFAYKIVEDGKSLIFSTDTELSDEDFRRTEENAHFFQDTDLLVLDAQYTLGEAIEKYDWGHTSYSMAVDFAAEWNIRTLALFHHDPVYDDRKVHSMLNSAKWYRARLHKRSFEVIPAMEGREIEI